jgi:hypothetical protein
MSKEEKMAHVPSNRRFEHLVEGKRQEWLEGLPERLTHDQSKDLRRALKSGERLEAWGRLFPNVPLSIMKLLRDYSGDDKKQEMIWSAALSLPVQGKPKAHEEPRVWSQTKEEGDRLLQEARERNERAEDARRAREEAERAARAPKKPPPQPQVSYVKKAAGTAAQQLKAIKERTGTNPSRHYTKPKWPGQ